MLASKLASEKRTPAFRDSDFRISSVERLLFPSMLIVLILGSGWAEEDAGAQSKTKTVSKRGTRTAHIIRRLWGLVGQAKQELREEKPSFGTERIPLEDLERVGQALLNLHVYTEREKAGVAQSRLHRS
jgi:hypothetical protein